MIVLHVGMGKTATSSLQANVYPRLAESGVIGVYNPRDLHLGLDAAINGFGAEHGLAKLAAAQSRMLISNETLLEWDPELWEASANRLLRIFGQDVTILITLRDPNSYLRSLYQQILHAGKIRPPQDLYLPADTYRAVFRFVLPGELDAINIDAFDMVRMISIYTERFASVVLVPFEAIGTLRFLTEIWGVPEAERAVLASAFAAATRVNTSYSRLAVRLTLRRERLLNRVGLRSRSASDMMLSKALAHARDLTFAPPSSVVPSWNRLMHLLGRYGPQTRYRLPEDMYLGRYLGANAAFYTALLQVPEGHVRFRNGQAAGFDLDGFRDAPAPGSTVGG